MVKISSPPPTVLVSTARERLCVCGGVGVRVERVGNLFVLVAEGAYSGAISRVLVTSEPGLAERQKSWTGEKRPQHVIPGKSRLQLDPWAEIV